MFRDALSRYDHSHSVKIHDDHLANWDQNEALLFCLIRTVPKISDYSALSIGASEYLIVSAW